jgi:ABC-type transport system involved in cytochrome bd biosynthesis fused ATPase/permease subunit
MNSQRYDKAIQSAQLPHDLEKMPSNELSEVGERGAALSGGQKARLALARCFYSNRDIYLLDDVLSAVNKDIADQIFRKGVQDLLANKTVVMVTSNPEVGNFAFGNFNRFQFLAEFDRVLFLTNGSINAVGKHSTLLETNPIYKDFFETHKHAQPIEEESVETVEKPMKNGKAQNGDVKQKGTLYTEIHCYSMFS